MRGRVVITRATDSSLWLSSENPTIWEWRASKDPWTTQLVRFLYPMSVWSRPRVGGLYYLPTYQFREDDGFGGWRSCNHWAVQTAILGDGIWDPDVVEG